MSSFNELLKNSGRKGTLSISLITKSQTQPLQVDNQFINTGEIIPSIDFTQSYVQPFILCAFKAHNSLFEKLGYKNPENNYKDLILEISLIENITNKKISRKFFITELKKSEVQSNDGIFYNVFCCDIHGFEFLEASKKSYAEIYNKIYDFSPVENVCEFLKDIIKCSKYPDDIKVENDTERYGLSEISEDLKISTVQNEFNNFKFINEAPIFMLKEYCKKFNIKIYQDFEGFHVIQHPVLSRFDKFDSLLSDRIPNSSRYYIADYIIGKDNSNLLDRNNYQISYVVGKNKKVVKLNENTLYSCVLLNNNPEDYKNFLSEKYENISGTSNRLLSSIYYEKIFGKGIGLINSKSICVYLSGGLEFKPGMIVKTDFSYNTASAEKQTEGDKNLSGLWFVSNCTFNYRAPQNIITRLFLTRFDNPKDVSVKKDPDIITSKNTNPGNFNSFDISNPVKSVSKEFKTTFNNLKNSIKFCNNSIFECNSLVSFISQGLNNFRETLSNVHNALRNVRDSILIVKNNYTQLRNILKFDKMIYEYDFNEFLDSLKDTITFFDSEEKDREVQRIKNQITQINIDIENINNAIKNFNKPDYSFVSSNSIFVSNIENLENKKHYKEEQLKKIREDLRNS